jgi:uncharacterized protein (TIGR00369 family)
VSGDDPLAATPPAARLLGRRVLTADRQRGAVELEFQATQEFVNRHGHVQGGMLAAMLDSAVGCAAVAALAGQSVVTLTMNVTYLRPAAAGPMRASGRVVHRGKSIAFADAELRDHSGEVVATATATLRIVRSPA